MGARRCWISLPLLLICLSGAQAEQALGNPEAPTEPARALLSAQLAERPRTPEPEPLLAPRTWRFRKGGVEVRRQVQIGERDVELGVKGPLLKRKRLGLAFEVRF